ncbi:MAG: hypothetical protein MUO77_04665 [Anaerolineales bacterium]|nr:hypothetical protein [Anaerolineales bacterium]
MAKSKRSKMMVPVAVEPVLVEAVAEVVAELGAAIAEAVEAAAVVEAVTVPAVVEAVTVPAVLTRRNRVATTAVLVRTEKKVGDRAEHTKLAWDVVAAALPATATELIAALEAAGFDATTRLKLVSFSAYLSYMIRRGALAEAPKVEVDVPALVAPQAS